MSLISWGEFVHLHSHTQKDKYSTFFKTINVFTDRNRVGFCLKESSGLLTVNSNVNLLPDGHDVILKSLDNLPKIRRGGGPFQFLNCCHIFKKGTTVKKNDYWHHFEPKNQENDPKRAQLCRECITMTCVHSRALEQPQWGNGWQISRGERKKKKRWWRPQLKVSWFTPVNQMKKHSFVHVYQHAVLYSIRIPPRTL